MKLNKILSLFIIFISGANSIFAEGGAAETNMQNAATIMLVFTIIIIALVLWLAMVYSEKNDNNGNFFFSPLKKLNNIITGAAPLEKEKEILLDHDYDGIRELDNRIPPWFHAMFWGTIIFAVIYMISYHVIGTGNVQTEEYIAEVQAAAFERDILIRSGAFINEETVKFKGDAATLASGKEIYDKNCATCHGFKGEGLVGPNFTDEYWIHGGGIKNIFKTIKYGVPQKGMISWESQLDPTKMQEVSSYIISLEGTNPPNGKAPEGNVWEEPASNSENSGS
ncbi:MAG: c-type cytochrome [Bacteroidetes bacterium]|nr:c-type cytochrome [Bacteroidota bacterium]